MTDTLLELERAFRLTWSADATCIDAKSLAKWHPDNAAHGQCGPIVQDLLAGDLLIADVSGGNSRTKCITGTGPPVASRSTSPESSSEVTASSGSPASSSDQVALAG